MVPNHQPVSEIILGRLNDRINHPHFLNYTIFLRMIEPTRWEYSEF